jgi:predicted MFS family arabinose efflux permease
MSPRTNVLRITLVGLTALAIAMGIGRFAFTPLLPLMQDDGLVGIADGGILASVHFVGYWLGAVFAAKLHYAPRSILRLSLVTIGLCTLGMGLTDNLALWMVFRWLCGVASAFTLVLISSHTLKHLAAIGGAAMPGWVFAGVGAGIAAAGLGTLAIMVNDGGSALGWQIFGAVSLFIILILSLSIGPEVPKVTVKYDRQGSQRAPLDWRAVTAYGAAGLGYIIPATYLPVMAREIVESPTIFGWSWPVFGLAAFLSTPLASWLKGRVPMRRIWSVSQLVMAVGLILPIVHPHIGTIIVAGICVGGTFMVITMAGMQEAHRLAPPEDVQRHIAILTAAFATGQIIGPLFAGLVHDLTGDFAAALLLTGAILAATAVGLSVGRPKNEVLFGRDS